MPSPRQERRVSLPVAPEPRRSFQVSLLTAATTAAPVGLGSIVGLESTTVGLQHSCHGQHELRWQSPITLNVDGCDVTLDAGHCNMQQVKPTAAGQRRRASHASRAPELRADARVPRSSRK